MAKCQAIAAILALLFVVAESATSSQGPYQFKSAEEAAAWGKEVQELRRRYEKQDPQAKAMVEGMFAAWQVKFRTRSEQEKKLGSFEAYVNNLWKTADINVKAPNTGWWGSTNAFADLDFATFSRLKLLPKLSSRVKRYTRILPWKFRLASGFNWRTTGKVTPIKNQGGCGSCWAFAAVASLESRYLIKRGLNTSTSSINLSEQQVVDCVRSPRKNTAGTSYNSGGCGGGWSDEAMNYALKYNITTEARYPYTGTDGTCRQRVLNRLGRQTVFKQRTPNSVGWRAVTSNNVTAMKQAIRYSPAVFYFRVESDFQAYSGGIYSKSCTGTNINHAMVYYGWQEILATGNGMWLVKNSWGTGWGESGYARVRMLKSSGGLNAGLCSGHTYAYLPNDYSVYYTTPLKIVG